MSDSVNTHASAHASDEDALAAIGVEPDEVSTTFLLRVAAGIVVLLVLGVVVAYGLFFWQTSVQLEKKGYSVESHVPRTGTPAQ